MSLTTNTLLRYITQEIGRLPRNVGALEVVNRAGEELVNAWPWEWLQGARELVDLTADQDYILLPTDVRTIVSLQPVDGLNLCLHRSSPDDLGRISSRLPVTGWTYWYAPGTRELAGEPRAVLDIVPTPTETSVGAASLSYNRKWRRAERDDSTLFVPDWMHHVVIDMVRAVAAGYVSKGGLPMQAHVAMVLDGHSFQRATEVDASMVADEGTIRGTAVFGRQSLGRGDLFLSGVEIADPE